MARFKLVTHAARQAVSRLSMLHHQNAYQPAGSTTIHLDNSAHPFACPYCPKRLLSEGGRVQHIARSPLCKAAHRLATIEALSHRIRVKEGKRKAVDVDGE